MVFKQQPIEHTHDLGKLIELCSQIDSSFLSILQEAETLNPYATIFRYPDEVLEPEKNDVLEAIYLAETILAFIENKIG